MSDEAYYFTLLRALAVKPDFFMRSAVDGAFWARSALSKGQLRTFFVNQIQSGRHDMDAVLDREAKRNLYYDENKIDHYERMNSYQQAVFVKEHYAYNRAHGQNNRSIWNSCHETCQKYRNSGNLLIRSNSGVKRTKPRRKGKNRLNPKQNNSFNSSLAFGPAYGGRVCICFSCFVIRIGPNHLIKAHYSYRTKLAD